MEEFPTRRISTNSTSSHSLGASTLSSSGRSLGLSAASSASGPSTTGKLQHVQAPSACPFSGVAIDPAMWESFQASLARGGNSQQHNHHHQQQQPQQLPSTPLVPTTKPQNSIRVRVTNQTTQRFKDLVLSNPSNISEQNKKATLFDAIYNNPSVKDAHVRKWGTKIAKDVRHGSATIQVQIVVGNDEDNSDNKKLWPVEDLKQMTTQQLFDRVIESQLPAADSMVQIYLVCVPTVADSVSDTAETAPSLSSQTPPPLVNKADSPKPAAGPPTTAVPTTRRSKRLDAPFRRTASIESNTSSLHFIPEAMDDSAKSRLSSSANHYYGANRGESGGGGGGDATPPREPMHRTGSFTIDGTGSHFDSTVSAFSMSMSVADNVLEEDESSSGSCSGTQEEERQQQQQQPQHPLAPLNNKDKLQSTLGVQVINQTTKRSKDLLVDISDMVNVFDAVYNHEAVKAAHVRKWGGTIAKAVKDGTSEIKFSVWDDDTGTPLRVFSIEELKTTTTRQLYDLVSESSNLVKIYLQCCNVSDNSSILSNSHRSLGSFSYHGSTTSVPLTPNYVATVRPLPKRQASLRLETCGRPQFSLKVPPSPASVARSAREFKSPTKITARRNHMKVSSSSSTLDRYGSCPVELSTLSGRKAVPSGGHESLIASARLKTQKLASFSVDSDKSLLGKTFAKPVSSSPRNGKQNATWEVRKSPKVRGVADRTGAKKYRATSHGGSPFSSQVDLRDSRYPRSSSELKRLKSETALETDNKAKVKGEDEQKKEKLKEFMRMLRAKKTPELRSQRSLIQGNTLSTPRQDDQGVSAAADQANNIQPVVPLTVPTTELKRGSSLSQPAVPLVVETTELKRGSSLSQLRGRKEPSLATTIPLANVVAMPERKPEDQVNHSLKIDALNLSNSRNKGGDIAKTNDKIARFLALQNGSANENPRTNVKKRLSACSDIPPIKEISVFANEDGSPPDAPEAPVSPPGVSLSPSLVKEIFPYHVVLDADFRIAQVGNSLEMLIQESSLVGRAVDDIMEVTGPVPMHDSWDWSVLEKMKDKTIFLETVLSPAMDERVKLKGTLVEVSKSPKQVMLVLFPNVKNLAELEEANLSMADLPLHSCQREAVLLGEHSKSEVNLTNHLDKLHRDLIDSMEQQIKDRTEQLAEANTDLERANVQIAMQSARQLEHFACMSHEIRTPLNCIVGMSSLLLDDAEEMDPMHADSIKMINTSGDLLKAVVDDVLDYAKLESGSFEVDIKEADLQHTLSSVTHSISQKIQEKNVRLRLHYSPLLPETFETDSRRLQQVLFNLLGNAGKFSKVDSVIDFSVTVIDVASTAVNPDNTSNGKVVRFAVKDYGKGIEKKDFKSIFDPFSQASKETQTVYGGTGLGLSITSKLVNRLGGTISLTSEYGKFAEFTVDLPFQGQPVDIPKLRDRLRDTTIVLVEPKKHYDYSFTNHKIMDEPTPFQEGEANVFDLNVIRCEKLDSLSEKLNHTDAVSSGKHFAVLVQEDLYQEETIKRLEEFITKPNLTLITFGPNYSVAATKDRHYKSLEGLFPSALLESIAGHMERGKRKAMFSLADNCGSTTAPTPPITGGLFASMTTPTPPVAGGLFATATTPTTPVAGGLFSTARGAMDTAATRSLFATMEDNSKRSSVEVKPAPGGLFASINSNDLSAKPEIHVGLQQPQSCSVVAATSKQQKAAVPDRNMKVLYAEDNMVNQKVLSRVLNRTGISNITLVDNGKKAVDICEVESYDVIFMDIQMPVMGGMEATKLIMERNPDAKVIFVTAHALDEFKAQAEAVGATSFISKPFRLDDIQKLLERLGF